MSYRSSISSSRRALALGATLVAGVVLWLDRSSLPPTPFYGGQNLAMHVERLALLDAREGVEVLALGDSYVAAGVDARGLSEALGDTVYAFGLISSDLHAQALILEHVILPEHRPERLLWCVGSEARRASQINHVYLASPAVQGSTDAWGRLRTRLRRGFPAWQRRRPLGWLGAFEMPLNERYDDHGYRHEWRTLAQKLRGERPAPPPGAGRATPFAVEWGRRHSMNPVLLPDAMLDEFASTEEEARATFERVLGEVLEAGIEVLAWTPPWFESKFEPDNAYPKALAEGKHDGHHAWLLGVLEERGVPHLNLRYYEPVSTSAEHFRDETHLNHAGATVILPELRRYLEGGAVPERFRGIPSPAEQRALEARR